MAERRLEMLLHPRVPPLIRRLPHVESLILYRGEEGDEEVTARKALKLSTMEAFLPESQEQEPRKEHPPPSEFSEFGRGPQTSFASASMSAFPTLSGQAPPQAREPVTPSTVVTTARYASPQPVEVAPSVETQVIHQPIPSKPMAPLQTGLESTSASEPLTSGSVLSAPVTEPDIDLDVLMRVAGDDEDEDEEIPAIDLASDTDSEGL